MAINPTGKFELAVLRGEVLSSSFMVAATILREAKSMSDKAPLFSIAVQGGGARLAELLVALEVIQKAEVDGEIRIAALSGTSAGAIAAAIYACGPGSVEKARQYLNERSPAAAKRMLPTSTFGWARAVYRVLRGKAACGDGKMEDELEALFRHLTGNKTDTLLFSHLDANKKQLRVIASQLRSRQKFVFHGDTQDLLHAISNSAAFPLVLRGYRSIKTNPFVDGGLCENLPAEMLLDPHDANGQVLALTFPERAAKDLPSGIFSYLMELFSTAINNSVVRTVSLLPTHNVLQIDAGASTFSFSTAFDPILNEARFKVIRLETKQWLDRNIAAAGAQALVLPLAASNRVALSLSNDLFHWYEHAIAPIERRNVKSTFNIVARSLKSAADDTIEKTKYFAPMKESLPCVRVFLSPSEWQALFREIHPIQVWDPEGKAIGAKVLPMYELNAGAGRSGYRGHLVLFDKVLPAMSDAEFARRGPYKLRYVTEMQDPLKPFRTKGYDYVQFSNAPAEYFPNLEVSMIYPQTVQMHPTAMIDGKLARPMDPGPLADLQRQVRPGFKLLGWQADGCGPSSAFRVDVRAAP